MDDFSEKDLITPCNSNCSFCFLNYADVLGENYLFRELKQEEIGQIIKTVHHQVKQYAPNEIIAHANDPYNSLYIIVKGSVVGEIADFEGKVLRIEELSAPDTIATAFIFGDNNQLPVTVTATEDTRLLAIPREDLLRLFRSHEKVLHNYLNIMANRAQHLSRKIKMLGLQSIRGKLAYYILDQVKKNNSSQIKLKHSQTQLAEIFGIARPSLARVIRELNDEGIIETRGKNLVIKNKIALSGFLK